MAVEFGSKGQSSVLVSKNKDAGQSKPVGDQSQPVSEFRYSDEAIKARAFIGMSENPLTDKL